MDGLATGVSYVNKEDMQEYQVNAKTVVLGASAGESRPYCSTPNRRPTRVAWLTAVAWLVNICMILLAPAREVSCRSYWTASAIMKMVRRQRAHLLAMVADNKKLISPWVSHRIWRRFSMPSYGFGGGIQHMNGMVPDRNGKTKRSRRLRRIVKG
jgi:hypothetical protein